MGKTLTISIAAYNVENYIRQTLDSLIDESVIDDLEILVIDDGGTDKTLEIAQEYANRYPQSIFPVHKVNGGYGSTINTGIEIATGKYFKQLDGDDWYQTENLKSFISALKNTNSDCVLTYFYQYHEKNDEYICKECFNYIEEGEYNIEKLELKERFSIKNATYRTDLIKKMNERLTEHCFYTDAEFATYPVIHVNSICVKHLPIYVYRLEREGQSISLEGIKKHYKDQEIVFWNVANFYIDKTRLDEPVKRKVVFYTLSLLCHDWYLFHSVLPFSIDIIRVMKEFEKKVRSVCPEVLEEIKKNRKIFRYLINSRYLLYPLVHIRLSRQYK